MTYSYLLSLRLETACNKTARTSVRVIDLEKTKLLPLVLPRVQERNTAVRLISRLVSIIIVEFHFTEMIRDRHLANERYCIPFKCCLTIKLCTNNRGIFSGVFCFNSNVEFLPS